MDNTQIKQYIDNVNINIETPSDDSDIGLQALERDNWGSILNNKTFKIIKENFRLIKTSFNNFISNVTNEINTLVNKTNTIENNVNTVQSTVNELKVNVGKINESTLNLLANKETTNIFKELNTFEKGINTKSINLENNTLSVMEGETITIGDINKSINIVGKDTTLKYNGEEIKGGNNSNNGSITLPNNLVYNNQANDFTILPTYNSLNFATEKYVNDEMQDYIKHEEKMNWMGTDGYGGLLQDAGTKKVGIAYYDKANKQMVVPTVENSLTYFEGSKFIPISDYQNAKKLENLSENWQLIFNGLLQPVSRINFVIPVPKKASKIRILSSIGIDDLGNDWVFQEFSFSKSNFTLANGEHYLNFFKETDKYYYFNVVSTTSVDDNYAYIYVK